MANVNENVGNKDGNGIGVSFGDEDREEVERVKAERNRERLQTVRELEHLADHLSRYPEDR